VNGLKQLRKTVCSVVVTSQAPLTAGPCFRAVHRRQPAEPGWPHYWPIGPGISEPGKASFYSGPDSSSLILYDPHTTASEKSRCS